MFSPNALPEFEFDGLRSTTVTLAKADVDWAVHTSQTVDQTQQWQMFLQAMAVKGLQGWLQAGGSALALDLRSAELAPGSATCEVNGFRLGLVTQGSLSDEVAFLPANALAQNAPQTHLYLLIEVQDEADQVTILGGLRGDRTVDQTPQANGTCAVPVQAFDLTPEDVLLYLTCLNPAQLAAAAAPSPAQPSPQRPKLINVGLWLRDQLDAVADGLAWTLLPPLAPSHALMSVSTPAEQLEGMLREVELTGLTIPQNAKGAYTDLQPLGTPLRLYALTWPLWTAAPEWSLLLFLGPIPGAQIPQGTRLLVQHEQTPLAEQTVGQGQDANYLYIQVIGTWEEQFTASVTLPDGSTFGWPPFGFQPGTEGAR